MEYPKYFENTITGNIFEFESIDVATIYKAKDGVTRLSCDSEPKKTTPHTDIGIWREVFGECETEVKGQNMEDLTINDIREIKEQAEEDINKILLNFINKTGVYINDVDAKIATFEEIGGRKRQYADVKIEIAI